MNYEEWARSVPKEITGDSLWKIETYRLALFLMDGHGKHFLCACANAVRVRPLGQWYLIVSVNLYSKKITEKS